MVYLKEGKSFHVKGKLVVASGESLSLIVDKMAPLVCDLRTVVTIIVTPMPRYLKACCATHDKEMDDGQRIAEKERIIRAVWNMKREILGLLMKRHAKNFILVSPLEVLGLRESVEGVEQAMPDGVHLKDEATEALAGHILSRVEEHFTSRKRGPTEKAGPSDKRHRSEGGDHGGRGGHGGHRGGSGGRGGWRGGRGANGGARTYHMSSGY